VNKELVRYFIVSTGRCGSSLLAAILSDAGADFGLPKPSDWKQDSGALEHPDINYVSRQFRRAAYLQPKRRSNLLAKYIMDIRRSLGKKRARQVLDKITYAKSDNIDLWIWHLMKMGYSPRIIVSFRDFAATARSFFVLRGMDSGQFTEYYRRIYENSLLMLDVYGGCAISFEELIDTNETKWADVLSQLTSVQPDVLLHHRNLRLKSNSSKGLENRPIIQTASEDIRAIEKNLRSLKGCHVSPSPPILRKWDQTTE